MTSKVRRRLQLLDGVRVASEEGREGAVGRVVLGKECFLSPGHIESGVV